LMSLAAVVGGVMRSPLTGVVFAMELTHQWDAVIPLVIASTAAYLLSVLVLKRSVLTEKVVRRGTHLTREYSVDPLEIFLIGEIMPRNSVSFRLGTTLSAAAKAAAGTSVDPVERRLYHTQRLYPVLDESNNLAGIITQHQLFNSILQQGQSSTTPIDQIMVRKMVVGYPDMTLREAVNLMAASGISSLPVVDRKEPGKVLSVVAMDHILEARLRDVNEERKAERVLKLPAIFVLGTGWFLRRRRNDNAAVPK
ncbi:MAG: CBS domain-containing protein, partial [Gammaproteobacteria bacterium]